MSGNFTKSQKGIIVLSGIWTVISLISAAEMADSSYGGFSMAAFLGLACLISVPVWLYWAGVWIWGFGYILKLLAWLSFPIRKILTGIKLRKCVVAFALFILWLITPLCLAALINDFSSSGIASHLGYAMGNTLLVLLAVMVVAKKRGTSTRHAVLAAILISSLFQAYSKWDTVEEAIEARTIKAELKNVPPEEILSAIKSSNTKLGKAFKEYVALSEKAEEKVGSIYSAIDCQEPLCGEVLSNTPLREKNTRNEIIKLLQTKKVRALGANGEIQAIYDEVAKKMQDDSSLPTDIKRGLVNGYNKTRKQLNPFIEGFIQGHINLYDSVFAYYDFIGRNESQYYFNPQGAIIFSSQIPQNEFEKYQTAVTKSADELAKKQNMLLEEYNRLQQDGTRKLQE